MDPFDSNRPLPSQPASFWPVVLRHGLIWTGAAIVITLLGFLTNNDPAMPDTSPVVRIIIQLITLLVIPLSVVSMAIKAHRDNDLGGRIELGRCTLLGVMTGLAAGFATGVFSVIFVTIINPEYSAIMLDMVRDQYEQRGMSSDQIEMGLSWSKKMFSPVGLVISQLFLNSLLGTLAGLATGAVLKRG